MIRTSRKNWRGQPCCDWQNTLSHLNLFSLLQQLSRLTRCNFQLFIFPDRAPIKYLPLLCWRFLELLHSVDVFTVTVDECLVTYFNLLINRGIIKDSILKWQHDAHSQGSGYYILELLWRLHFISGLFLLETGIFQVTELGNFWSLLWNDNMLERNVCLRCTSNFTCVHMQSNFAVAHLNSNEL